MHGRLKVRTTAEEKERKQKERALKVKAYKVAMAKIQLKRERKEFDDEMMQFTMQILLRNPEVFTMWNIRRQCIKRRARIQRDFEVKQEVFDDELDLTETCLKVNPKCYFTWHHRCWILEHSPQAKWDREMMLCNKYLRMDERNFHTWNHRRYAAAKAGVDLEKEVEFCTDKIKTNFSNYSSWHYRSKLLPQLYPYKGTAVPKRPMSESKLKEELEMVLTAAFTDPFDSSAWFYQRWLLGYSRPELDVCAFRCDERKALISLTKSVPSDSMKVTLYDNDGKTKFDITDWISVHDEPTDTTWMAVLPSTLTLDTTNDLHQLEVNIPKLDILRLIRLKPHANSFYYLKPPNSFIDFSTEVVDELKSQLESCDSLLEYEPDSKWTLLTSALLMRAIDPKEYLQKSLDYMDKLQKVDVLRAGYYKDLASNWIFEELLTKWAVSTDIPNTLNLKDHPQLSSITYPQYLIIADEVELSDTLQEFLDKSKLKLRTFNSLEA